MNYNSESEFSNESKETLQKRHYFLYDQLRTMVNEVPMYNYINNNYNNQILIIVFFFSRNFQVDKKYNKLRYLIKVTNFIYFFCYRPHHLSIVQAANKRELDAFDKRYLI